MGSHGIFSRLYKPIYRKKEILRSPSKAVPTDMLSKFSADMSSYALACETDPGLKSIDLSLHKQTNEVISSLAARKTDESLSLDSLVDPKLIRDCKDVLKNKDLHSLVDVYCNSATKTIELCNSVEKYTKKAHIGQQIIQLAMKQFEKESLEAHDTNLGENKNKKKYPKTLEELNKFKAMGDHFDNDSSTHFQSVVAAATDSPPVVTALAGALASLFGYVRKWFKKMWKDYIKAVKRQSHSGLVLSLERDTKVNVEAGETIRVQVDKLSFMIESVHQTVNFAVERQDEEAMILTMHKLKDMVEEFSRKIKEAGEITNTCSAYIATGRVTIIAHIASFSAD